MKAIVFESTGGPEVLQVQDVPQPQPGEGEVLIRVAAAGVNFIDTYIRSGLYESALGTPGFEVAGEVVELGAGVTGVQVGDRVATANATGGYAEFALAPADRVARIDPHISDANAASTLLQGLTTHALATSVYPLRPGSVCLITAGSGGVGLMLTQVAKHLGAKVITLVSTDEKEKLSREAGADEVLRYEDYSADAVPGGVDVVYDGVGAATFATGLEVLRPTGTMVLFGAASGPVEPLDPQELNKHGSLYLTRPSVWAWTATAEQFQQRAAELMGWIADGTVQVTVGAEYPLEQAAQAHRDLQDRKTTGSVVLKVN